MTENRHRIKFDYVQIGDTVAIRKERLMSDDYTHSNHNKGELWAYAGKKALVAGIYSSQDYEGKRLFFGLKGEDRMFEFWAFYNSDLQYCRLVLTEKAIPELAFNIHEMNLYGRRYG